MVEIDIEKEVAKYQAELDSFLRQLQQLDNQRAAFMQAIAERQGVLAYLRSLNQHKEQPSVVEKTG